MKHTKQLTLVIETNHIKGDDPFDKIFSLMTSKESIRNALNKLYTHLNIEQACLTNCNIVIKPFVAGYQWVDDPNPQINNSRASLLLYKSLHKHLKNRSSKCSKYLHNSPFTPFIPFWLKALWSHHYANNDVLNIKFEMCSIEWNNLPVSVFEVISWHDQICGMIRDFSQPGVVMDQWLKYWQLKCFQVQALIQILEYMKLNVGVAIQNCQ